MAHENFHTAPEHNATVAASKESSKSMLQEVMGNFKPKEPGNGPALIKSSQEIHGEPKVDPNAIGTAAGAMLHGFEITM